ncbi:hypothetical protein M885DRAFT_442141, partial [Pelagophyceae sp. CCMP2097]
MVLREAQPLLAAARGCTLFVRRLPQGATEDLIRRAFKGKCTVTAVRLPLDGATKRPKGFAFVTVEETDHSAVQKKLNGSLVGGSMVSVELSSS